MRTKPNWLPSGLIGHLLTLLSGNIVAHLITLASYPILSRIFSVEDFGLFSFFLSIVLPISVIATGKYELATIICTDDKNAKNTVFNGTILAIGLALAAWAGLYLTKDLIQQRFHTTLLEKIWLTVPFAIVIQGAFLSFNAFLQRKEQFRLVAFNKIIQTTGTAVFSIILGLCSFGTGLVYGYLFGWTLLFIGCCLQLRKIGFWQIRTDWPSIKESFVRFKEYPLFMAVPIFLYYMVATIQTWAILENFTNIENGYFGFARQVLIVPLGVISTSFNQVFFVQSSTAIRENGAVWATTKKYLLIAFAFSVAICLPFIVGGEAIFKFFFGEKWALAGKLCSTIGPAICLSMAVLPFASILISLNRVRAYSLWQIGTFAAYLFLLKSHPTGFIQLVQQFAILEAVAAAVLLGLIIYYINQFERNKPRSPTS